MEIPDGAREQVNEYIRSHFAAVPEVVTRYEETALTIPIPPHHITAEIGKLIHVLARSVGARRVLEIGTMWGYSTWWLYTALPVDAGFGAIVTLEKELKHFTLAQKFFAEMQMTDHVDLRHCDALEELGQLEPGSFDVVFLDADKREYPRLLELLQPLLRVGGLLIVDNIIYSSNWHGKTVADETDDERIVNAQRFNQMIANSCEWVGIPLAVRSGVMLALKTKGI